MSKWKSRGQIDEAIETQAINRSQQVSDCPTGCDIECQEESTGIMAAEGRPFCNENGKPSIAVDTGGHAELRDGSKNQPIQLTGLQAKQYGKFAGLMGVGGDGTLYAIRPTQDDVTYKVLSTKDGFCLEEDVTENCIDATDVYTGGTPDFVLGGRITTDANGKSCMRLVAYDISDLLSVLEVEDC